MLERDEFDLLVRLEAGGSLPPEAVVAGADGNQGVLSRVIEKGYVECRGSVSLSDKGAEELSAYQVKRAVLFAAGFGSRLVPVTLETPKPLVTVNGRRIIDSILDALIAAEVTEIYIVRGYKAEQFDQLLEKYPTLRFIDNPIYDTTNNISSAVAAKGCFQRAYAFESDLLFVNPALISKYQYTSNYLGVPVESTDDWCFTVQDGKITHLDKGSDTYPGAGQRYHMFGMSYWTAEDGRRLEKDLPRIFANPELQQIFWDDVAINHCDGYDIAIRPCSFEDICEIDTYEELKTLDPSYQ